MPFDLQTWCVLWHPKSTNFVSSDQTVFSQYFTGLSKCCAANFKRASTCIFLSNRALRGERAYRPWRLSALLICFLFVFQVFLKLSTSDPWLLDNSSDNYFHSSVRNLARSTWSWPVCGEIMFFPLPDYGPQQCSLEHSEV